MANIYDDVKVTKDVVITDGYSICGNLYKLEFDGTTGSIAFEPQKEHLECFKCGILAERERIWDESDAVASDEVMKRLLRMD